MYDNCTTCDRCRFRFFSKEGGCPPGWIEAKLRPARSQKDDRKKDDVYWHRVNLCPQCILDFQDFLEELRDEEKESEDKRHKVETGA